MPGRHAPGGRADRRLRRRRTGEPRPRPDARASAWPRWPPTPTRRRSSAAPTETPTAGTPRRHSAARGRSTSAGGTSANREGDPVVIDWRAPIARAFYRATPSDRMGVRLRRRFGFHARRARRSYEDEHLDRGESAGPGVRPAARGDRAPARRADARHRRHHPARPGRPGPRRSRRLALHPGRAGHRQDRRRPAPRGVPALHLPRAAAPLRRAGRRAQPGLPALHRAGAAGARRGRRRAVARSTTARRPRAGPRRSRPPRSPP